MRWLPTKLKSFVLGMFFLFYLALGASVFSAIESPIEQQEISNLIEKKNAFIYSHECITRKNSQFNTKYT